VRVTGRKRRVESYTNSSKDQEKFDGFIWITGSLEHNKLHEASSTINQQQNRIDASTYDIQAHLLWIYSQYFHRNVSIDRCTFCCVDKWIEFHCKPLKRFKSSTSNKLVTKLQLTASTFVWRISAVNMSIADKFGKCDS
jgi:hypothetical protein